jgi:polygalacturonase
MRHTIFFLLCCIICSLSFAQKNTNPIKILPPKFKKDTFDITRFGAKTNSDVLSTTAINNAISACSKNGGGVVLIPTGLWNTGPIVLKNNVNLHLAKSATLVFSDDFNDYKLVASNWEGMPQMRNESPISAEGATNIAITGFGIIEGNGDAWRMVKKDKVNASHWKRLTESGGVLSDDKKTWYPSAKSVYGNTLKNPGAISPEKTAAFYDSVKDFLRPNLMVLSNCKNILLEGVTFQNSPAWCLHPMMCENIVVRNIKVKNPSYAQNGDGIDVESCKNVTIENSIFDVGDDALCMKSGRDEAGRKRNKPTENVFIKDCVVYASHGGFVIGSEMSGGVKNIYVENCTFIGTDIGLRFKTTRGRGGVVENINVKNIFMKDIVGEAILFDMYYAAKDPVPQPGEKREVPKVELKPFDITTPVFKNFNINNVYCDGAEKAIFVRGLPESHINNIKLNNIFIKSKIGIEVQEASSIAFNNVEVISNNTNPCVDIVNSDNLTFNGSKFSPKALLGFYILGERSKDIKIENADFKNVTEKYKLDSNVAESVISIK